MTPYEERFYRAYSWSGKKLRYQAGRLLMIYLECLYMSARAMFTKSNNYALFFRMEKRIAVLEAELDFLLKQ